MLTHLSIRNIVLVEKAQIAFTAGLCVLTGETGAGKSILLDALGLTLGRRAEARLVRCGAEEASVTACFELAPAIAQYVREHGIEAGEDGELVIRRTLSSEGKSKCYVNDTPVSARMLKALGEQLIEIHGQHDQRGLMEARLHMGLLDLYGQLEAKRAPVAAAFTHWREQQSKLQALQEALAQAKKEQDYLEHVTAELGALAVEVGEAEQLTAQRTAMMQGEKMAQTLNDALAELQGDTAALSNVQRLLMRRAPKEEGLFDPIIDTLEKAQLEVQQAESQIEQLQQQHAYDPAHLEQMEERLFAIRAAERKHDCSADELPALLERSQQLLAGIANDSSACAQLEAAIAAARTAYVDAAKALSGAREKAARKLEKALHAELAPLKMEKTRFAVALQPQLEAQWGVNGMDNVQFEASTNPGQALAPLQQIASGGELSRFMLALKKVLSSNKSAGTLIFDEIDTGTGGAVADAIGARLASIAQHAQVLVVTHLPQVAARANHHLFIEKTQKGDATHTSIRGLNAQEREEEIARMLAGAEITSEARSAAKKLLELV